MEQLEAVLDELADLREWARVGKCLAAYVSKDGTFELTYAQFKELLGEGKEMHVDWTAERMMISGATE